jgi:hypothetical protein
MMGDEIGNSNFLKKVIKKSSIPGAFNKRARREDSVSSSEEVDRKPEKDQVDQKPEEEVKK